MFEILLIASIGFHYWYRGKLMVEVQTDYWDDYDSVAVYVDGEWVKNIPTDQMAYVEWFRVGKHTLTITRTTDSSRVIVSDYHFEIERDMITYLTFS